MKATDHPRAVTPDWFKRELIEARAEAEFYAAKDAEDDAANERMARRLAATPEFEGDRCDDQRLAFGPCSGGWLRDEDDRSQGWEVL